MRSFPSFVSQRLCSEDSANKQLFLVEQEKKKSKRPLENADSTQADSTQAILFGLRFKGAVLGAGSRKVVRGSCCSWRRQRLKRVAAFGWDHAPKRGRRRGPVLGFSVPGFPAGSTDKEDT